VSTKDVTSRSKRRAPRRRGWGPTGLLLLIDGVMTAIGGVYLSTKSIEVTIVAAAAGVALAAWIMAWHTKGQ
jgi:hypothetical protein